MKINDILNEILQLNVPIIFLDTCAYLDSLRIPFREEMNFENLQKIKDIKKKYLLNELYLVTSEEVIAEYQKNKPNVLVELENSLEKHEEYNKKYYEIIKLFSAYELIENRLEMTYGNWVTNLDIFCDSLISDTKKIEVTETSRSKAFERMYLNIPPSRKGANSIKDCIIFESLLELSKKLREKGFNEKICFISANTKDFGSVSQCKVQNDLDEFQISYANEFRHLYHNLGL